MKRIGFIADNVDFSEPISRILKNFNIADNFQVETINRLNPKLPLMKKVQSLFEICDVIVFYISRGTPSIYYEIGLAQGAKKSVILIANSYNLIPFDLAYQKCIIVNDGDFENVGYELFESITRKSTSWYNREIKSLEQDIIYNSYFNEYKPELTYKDLYAYSGPRRHKLFEQWFSSLANNVMHWKVISANKDYSPQLFDFMLWNSANDPELKTLGNPIPVELKALNTMNSNQLMSLAEKIKKQGLRSLILLTTALNNKRSEFLANKVKQDYGILLIALGREDLIEVKTPNDLYFAIKRQLLNIIYRGG